MKWQKEREQLLSRILRIRQSITIYSNNDFLPNVQGFLYFKRNGGVHYKMAI